MKELVTSKWLKQNLNNPNLIILDASLKQSVNTTNIQQFEGTIPNARFFDLKNVYLDKESPFPNTIPKPEHFELECRKLGINNDSEIVVFDSRGIYSSPRAWWLFKVMGHQNIAVLNGGLPDWISNTYPVVENHFSQFEEGNFYVAFNQSLVVDFNQVSKNTIAKEFTIVDARSEGRFNGTEKEPRAHLKNGSIENSVNIPYQQVLKNGRYKSKIELKAIFENKCTNENDLVFSCGSGITACIVMLACHIGYSNSLKVYDGSWTEWAERNDLKFS
ncbi:sulfurtransferase [Psychroserpens sp.]|uniref:sulfurtransferase n=1 Tax=Psychroserpens sp. TaxID=2020870 RepID=UPI001B1833BB|nr:sulfurtransferase [Psychroserpens sp.]MBO6606686.1 sulfurtransferase [Psychroserpens sp.]MBO6631405.1 sulfurtransferase [Psychroserpens sp.]MBO6653390.1 sulfurtransferase [Psychroserpens sp.]MBO6680583.1 sulfurtransferase [Psychroserpens sp.]MBO6750459.1 sulfurtransferase [Psychroserpens sp.]